MSHAAADGLLVRAGILFDGTGAPPMRNAGVRLRGGLIEAVGPLDSLSVPADGPAREIDASHASVLPGLIDCHLHVGYAGHRSIQELEWPLTLEYQAIRAVGNAALALRCGFTSALDVGCRGQIAVAVRDAIERDGLPGPRLRVSGQVISSPAGCVDLWPDWIDVHPHARLGVIVSGVEEVRRVVREQVKTGVDNVKLEASGTGVHPLRPAIEATMTLEELTAGTEIAHQYGLSVAVHAERTEGIKNAIRAGADTVQHATYLDEEALDLLEDRPRTRLVFTTGVYDGIIHLGPRFGYPAAARQRFVDTWPTIVGNVRRAYERRVPFAVGSDCGGQSHPHGRYARNLTLLVRECGLPVEHAVRAATGYAAEAAWFGDSGTLQVGRRADLVVVRGDLTRNIELIEDEANVETVIQAGRVVKRLMAS